MSAHKSQSSFTIYFLFLLMVVVYAVPHGAVSQLLIRVSSIPSSTPKGAAIYLAGNINEWRPNNKAYSLQSDEQNGYWIKIPKPSGNLEFKFTRGSWTSVEADQYGRVIPNRVIKYNGEDTIDLEIASWEDLDGDREYTSTANDQVIIWDSAMWMPQLKRSRRISVYLPKDYNKSSKHYRVIYMLDGQNLFDELTAYAGEWHVDETLSQLEKEGYESAIVVAIDNGGPYRVSEYSPYPNQKYGADEGHAYIQFLVETLKPRVDRHFRTRTDPANTAIIGSSLGGLIAHYAYFHHPTVFGRVGILSPSYWFLPEFFDLNQHPNVKVSPRIYLLAGELEEGVPERTREMYQRLMDGGFNPSEVKLSIDATGNHSEEFWSRKFEEAYLWLFDSGESNN